MTEKLRFRFTYIGQTYSYWKIFEDQDFSTFVGTHSTESGIGLDALAALCDSDDFPAVFRSLEDVVERVKIERLP